MFGVYGVPNIPNTISVCWNVYGFTPSVHAWSETKFEKDKYIHFENLQILQSRLEIAIRNRIRSTNPGKKIYNKL